MDKVEGMDDEQVPAAAVHPSPGTGPARARTARRSARPVPRRDPGT